MRVRSTGLGKMEMVAGFTRLEPVENGYVIMELQSSAPTQFRIRAALTGADIRSLLKLVLKKPSMIFTIIGSMFQKENNNKSPEM